MYVHPLVGHSDGTEATSFFFFLNALVFTGRVVFTTTEVELMPS